MGRHNLTSRPILLHSIWNIVWSFLNAGAKSFCIIASQNNTTTVWERRHPPLKAIVFRLLALRCTDYIQWLLLLFFVIFSASLSGSDDFVLFDSLDGNDAYSQMFYVILQFCAQVKFATLDGNQANDNKESQNICIIAVFKWLLFKHAVEETMAQHINKALTMFLKKRNLQKYYFTYNTIIINNLRTTADEWMNTSKLKCILYEIIYIHNMNLYLQKMMNKDSFHMLFL